MIKIALEHLNADRLADHFAEPSRTQRYRRQRDRERHSGVRECARWWFCVESSDVEIKWKPNMYGDDATTFSRRQTADVAVYHRV